MKTFSRHRLRILSFIALSLLMVPHFLVPREGSGADWNFIEKDEEGLWFYDAETVECFPNHRIKVQTRKIYERKAVLAAVEKYGQNYKNMGYVLAQWEIDCFQEKFTLCSAIFYSRENGVIERYHAEEEGCLTAEDIPPDSHMELLRKKVCR